LFSLISAFLILFGFWFLMFICHLDFDIWNLAPRWIAAFSISYFSHLILDMFNKRGTQMFWPDRGGTSSSAIRSSAWSRARGAKRSFFVVLFALLFLAFPFSTYGVTGSLNWLLATRNRRSDEYKLVRDPLFRRIYRDRERDPRPISGRAELLDVRGKRMLVLLSGAILHFGRRSCVRHPCFQSQDQGDRTPRSRSSGGSLPAKRGNVCWRGYPKARWFPGRSIFRPECVSRHRTLDIGLRTLASDFGHRTERDRPDR